MDAFRIGHVNDKNNFMWRNGQEIVYNKFDPGQPDNFDGNEYCLHLLWPSWVWNDIPCHYISHVVSMTAVCERFC